MQQGVLAQGFSGSFACRAALVSDAENERGKRGNKSGMMMCTSANTQLDSLLYPRDERSATWAFPLLWLGTLWRQWIMYTCTHFPKTIQQRHFKLPAPFIHSSASQAHSLHLSVIGEWYLGFWPTHHFTQNRFLNRRPVFHPGRVGGTVIWAASSP